MQTYLITDFAEWLMEDYTRNQSMSSVSNSFLYNMRCSPDNIFVMACSSLPYFLGKNKTNSYGGFKKRFLSPKSEWEGSKFLQEKKTHLLMSWKKWVKAISARLSKPWEEPVHDYRQVCSPWRMDKGTLSGTCML